MKEKMHDKLCDDMKIQNRIDTIFTIFSLIINFTLLLINWSFAGRNMHQNYEVIVFVLNNVVIGTITLITVISLFKGRIVQNMLAKGIYELYVDETIDRYYPKELFTRFNNRNIYLMVIVLVMGILATLMPIILFTKLLG